VKKTVGTTTTMYPNTLYSQSGNTITRNVYDTMGNLVSTVNGGTSTSTVYIHPDILGSTNVITNASGQFLEAMNYRPFGSTNLDLGTTGNESRGYIGQLQDPESNLDYLNARYYDGSRGQFLSEDPINVNLTSSALLLEPQNLNYYAYANDNPVTGKDPTGKLVQLISRPVNDTGSDTSGSPIGIHTFYLVTPNNPGAVSFPGVAAGTQTFTVGGYPNSAGKLVGNIGTVDIPDSDIYYAYGNGESKIINRQTLSAPNGESDTQFINSLGSEYGQIANTGTNYFLGGKNVNTNVNYGNSNNFAYTLGTGAGVQSQLNSFNPSGSSGLLVPGYGYTLNTPGASGGGIIQQLQNIVTGLRNLVNIVTHK
jgi:RHS repeat-associated protein